MNIQFMTIKDNGIPTGEFNWKGEPQYRYIPDWDKLIEHASCEEEIEAIKKAKELCEKTSFEGFTFEIVFTAIADYVDFNTGKFSKKWQILQHPWYTDKTKEEMLEDIKLVIEECK